MNINLTVVRRGSSIYKSPIVTGIETQEIIFGHSMANGNTVLFTESGTHRKEWEVTETLAAIVALATDGSIHTAVGRHINNAGVFQSKINPMIVGTGRVIQVWFKDPANDPFELTLLVEGNDRNFELGIREDYETYITRYNALGLTELNSLQIVGKDAHSRFRNTVYLAIREDTITEFHYYNSLGQTQIKLNEDDTFIREAWVNGNWTPATGPVYPTAPLMGAIIEGFSDNGLSIDVDLKNGAGTFVNGTIDNPSDGYGTINHTSSIAAYADPHNITGQATENALRIAVNTWDDALGTTLLGSDEKYIPDPNIRFGLGATTADQSTYEFENDHIHLTNPTSLPFDYLMDGTLTITGGAHAGAYTMPSFKNGDQPTFTGLPGALDAVFTYITNGFTVSDDDLTGLGVTNIQIDLNVTAQYFDVAGNIQIPSISADQLSRAV